MRDSQPNQIRSFSARDPDGELTLCAHVSLMKAECITNDHGKAVKREGGRKEGKAAPSVQFWPSLPRPPSQFSMHLPCSLPSLFYFRLLFLHPRRLTIDGDVIGRLADGCRRAIPRPYIPQTFATATYSVAISSASAVGIKGETLCEFSVRL